MDRLLAAIAAGDPRALADALGWSAATTPDGRPAWGAAGVVGDVLGEPADDVRFSLRLTPGRLAWRDRATGDRWESDDPVTIARA